MIKKYRDWLAEDLDLSSELKEFKDFLDGVNDATKSLGLTIYRDTDVKGVKTDLFYVGIEGRDVLVTASATVKDMELLGEQDYFIVSIMWKKVENSESCISTRWIDATSARWERVGERFVFKGLQPHPFARVVGYDIRYAIKNQDDGANATWNRNFAKKLAIGLKETGLTRDDVGSWEEEAKGVQPLDFKSLSDSLSKLTLSFPRISGHLTGKKYGI